MIRAKLLLNKTQMVFVSVVVMICGFFLHEINAQEKTWRSLNGPYGGDVHSITFDPQNHNHLIAGTRAGIFHSYNGGLNWMPGNISIKDVTVLHRFRFKSDEESVVYAAGRGYRNLGTIQNSDIYFSEDSGLSWTAMSQVGKWNDIWVHRELSNRLFLAGYDGLFISTDSGQTFTPVFTNKQFFEIIGHPDDSDKIYAVGDNANLYVSLDGGLNWTVNGSSSAMYSQMSISILPEPPYTIFFSRNGTVCKTVNEGVDVTEIFSDNISTVRVAPSDSSVIWAVGGNDLFQTGSGSIIYRSEDGGDTWNNLTVTNGNYCFDVTFHPENSQHVFITRRFTGVLYSSDGGDTWVDRNKYLAGCVLGKVVPFEDGTDRILVGTSYDSLYETNSKGSYWKRIEGLPSRIRMDIKPDDSSIILAGHSDGLYRTEDGGENWTYISVSGCDTINDIEFSRCKPDYAYLECKNGLYFSSDSGLTWTKVHDFQVFSFEPDFFNDQNLVVCIGMGMGASVELSQDGGNSWQSVLSGFRFALTTDKMRPGYCYAEAIADGIMRSTDYGLTWETFAHSEIPGCSDMMVIESGRLMIGVTNQVYFSDDTGETIFDISDGINANLNLRDFASRIENREEFLYLVGNWDSLRRWSNIDNTAPSVQICSPNPGVNLHSGSETIVEWIADDDETVLNIDIFLSIDSGQSWPYVLMGGIGNSGITMVTLPDIESDTCRIKVVAYDTSWNENESVMVGDFSINDEGLFTLPSLSFTSLFLLICSLSVLLIVKHH